MRTITLLLGALLVLAPAAGGQSSPGPIQPGDRILLRVAGEPQLSDTFTVMAGPEIELPALGKVPLAGVARDSVRAHLTAFLSRFLNHPEVRAEVLLRLGILGEVTRPGFYALPTGAVLEDLIMAAGGMTQDARFEKAKLRRDDHLLFEGERLRRIVTEGRTLDALALRSGDALEIPRRPDQEGRVRILTALVTLPVAIYGLTRLF